MKYWYVQIVDLVNQYYNAVTCGTDDSSTADDVRNRFVLRYPNCDIIVRPHP